VTFRALAAGLALIFAPAPLAAQQAASVELPRPNLEQKMLLRCSAAFGLIAGEQARGDEAANRYPPLAERGREFFVRASAQVMDELGLTSEQLRDLVNAEVETLQSEAARAEDSRAYVDSVMQPCLLALDAAGL